PYEPLEVRVHGDTGAAEGVAQDDEGGLAAHTGQLDEVLEPAGHLAAEVLGERLRQPYHRLGLGPEEAGGAQDLLHLLGVGGGQILGGGVLGEEGGGGLVDAQDGGVGRRHGVDREREGVIGVQLRVDV